MEKPYWCYIKKDFFGYWFYKTIATLFTSLGPCSTSIIVWSNPTLTTALLYGAGMVVVIWSIIWLISYKNSKIVQLVYLPSPTMMLKKLNWDNLETRSQILKAEMVYKSLNGLSPEYLSRKFIPRSDINNSYDLRNSANKLAVPLPRTNYYKNSFIYSTVVWFSGTVYLRMLGMQPR